VPAASVGVASPGPVVGTHSSKPGRYEPRSSSAARSRSA